MKTTTVPAQVTTVEDKIAGNLSLTQMLLLAAPVFIGAASYALFPPNFKYALYKVIILALLMIGFGGMAIRIKGMLLVHWLVILFHYNARPRFFLYDKNDLYLRVAIPKVVPKPNQATIEKKQRWSKLVDLDIPTAERVKFEHILGNPDARLAFHATKKGGLHVTLTEVE